MNKIVDLLAIILPAVLIIFGFMRVGLQRSTKGGSATIKVLNGLTMIIAVLLLLIGIGHYLFPGGSSGPSGPKPKPIAVSKHSDAFNGSLENMLNVYYQLTEAFVNWDTVKINTRGAELVTALENVKTDELKNDTAKNADKIYLTAVDFISNSKGDAANIVQQPLIAKKREALNALTDNLRNLLITVQYDKAKVYYLECNMAFDDEVPGYWLSATKEVRNPYLGISHPTYQATMLTCGTPKDSINYMPQDTTAKNE